jgi:AcrR family transcriptional regulator
MTRLVIPERGTQSKRGRPRTDDKRRRILDAALGVFAERGYHGTAVPLVAEAAQVGTGTIYRYFASKAVLVNEVFRDAKSRLRGALLDDLVVERDPERLFLDLWSRLVRFARREPIAFQFLEMQDHVPYLDDESRAVEMEVLGPVGSWASSLSQSGRTRELPVEAAIALVWGALVGLIKAERLGYLTLSDDVLERAGQACWAAITREESPKHAVSRGKSLQARKR